MKIGNNANADAWQKYDKQTVEARGEDGKLQGVDHGASAVENLKEAGKNFLNTFDPTNHFRDTWGDVGKQNTMVGAGMAHGLAVLMIPWDLMREVADVFTGPVKMVKNLGDAAVQGATHGIAKLSGDAD